MYPSGKFLPDPLYNSVVVTKLINGIMYDGKKGVAQQIVYDAFAAVEEKTGKPALEVFQAALENIMPVLEVKARRCRRCNLSGADRGASGTPEHARHPLARHVLARTQRTYDGSAFGSGNHRCVQ